MQESNNWLLKRNVKAFYNLIEEESLTRGVKAMIQVIHNTWVFPLLIDLSIKSVGMGKLRPNIVMLGVKTDWLSCEATHLVDYFNMIQ